jgi:NitT/TauT family transport system substrate-binding protein
VSSSAQLGEYLATCNLTLRDVQIVGIAGPSALIGLQNGGLDAANFPDPLWVTAKKKGFGTEFLSSRNFQTGGLLMGSVATMQPQVAEAIIRALDRTIRTYLQGDYVTNPTVRQALITDAKIPAAALTAAPPPTFDPNMTIPTHLVPQIQATWIKANVLNYQTPLPVSAIVDSSLLSSVLNGQ